MLRLIIADDEKMIRESICRLIDWESLGIEVVSVCKNGLEAYDAILDFYPDIVLTDIKMPGLSGLELIEKLTDTREQIQFIILSGYNEFEYAKQAMRYGIRHYLLKPCNEEQIVEAVEDVMKVCYERQSAHAEPELNIRFEKSLFRNILIDGLTNIADLSRTGESYQYYLDFSHTAYELFYLYYLTEDNVQKCSQKITAFMQALFPGTIFHLIYVKNTLLIILKKAKKKTGIFSDFLENLVLPQQSVTMTWESEHFACLSILLERILHKLSRFDRMLFIDDSELIPVRNYNGCLSNVRSILQEYYDGNSSYEHFAEEILFLLQTVGDKDFLILLITNITLQCNRMNADVSSAVSVEFLRTLNKAGYTEEIFTTFRENFSRLLPPISRPISYKPFIEKLMNYTLEHLGDSSLSLKWISNHYLFMNVDYVSKQFYKQTGEKFSTWLNHRRIDKAKNLLLHCDTEKVYMVAESIGCGKNPQYFSQLFKKYTGITPTDYIHSNSSDTSGNSSDASELLLHRDS